MHTYTQFGASFEPWEYTDWIDESMSWKDTLYIGDWSPLAKMRVKGRDALKFFSAIAVNSFAKFDIGQAKHIVLCNDAGKIMGEGVLMRHAEEDYLFTSGPGVAWADYQFRKGNYDAEASQLGPRQFILQLQGPNSLFVWRRRPAKACATSASCGSATRRSAACGSRRCARAWRARSATNCTARSSTRRRFSTR